MDNDPAPSATRADWEIGKAMAWITKNSATMKIDRRDEPYLSAELRQKLEQSIITRYPTRRAALLPVLHTLQHEHGWLPHQAIAEAAEFLGVAPAEAMDTASFYEEFWLRPKGKYVIWVCQSLSCELLGSTSLLAKLKTRLGIEVGETTDDGKFTLMSVECLGSCGTAPCALVNEKLHENISLDNYESILAGLD